MTVGDFFEAIGSNPIIPLFYFVALPLTAFLASIFGKGQGHLSPWKEMYCSLIYAACIPGILSLVFNVYTFLFERGSVLQANIYTQILPIVVMVLTLWLVRRNVRFDQIPGFEKIGGLLMILVALISLMWILDRMRVFAITFIPFHWFIIAFIGILFLVRLGWRRMARH